MPERYPLPSLAKSGHHEVRDISIGSCKPVHCEDVPFAPSVALDAVSCLDGLEASLSSAAEAGDGQRGIREHAGPDHAIVSLADMKKHAILRTIRQLNGNKLMAAKLLGIGRTTLYRKLKEYLSPRQ